MFMRDEKKIIIIIIPLDDNINKAYVNKLIKYENLKRQVKHFSDKEFSTNEKSNRRMLSCYLIKHAVLLNSMVNKLPIYLSKNKLYIYSQ